MNEYWRNKLNKESSRCYATLIQGVRREVKNVDCGDVSVEDIKNAYFALYDDHPEFFYLSNTPQIAQKKSGFAGSLTMSCSCSVLMTPIYSKKEIEDCRLKIDRAKATIREKITPKTTDEQKVRLVAEHLVYNTTYEINNRYNQNAASALCFGKAQCSGISKAFKLLMDDLGVYCISVSGEAIDEQGNVGPHAWNIVKLSEEFYHVDITFMLGANTSKKHPLINIYLFYDDNAIAKNHSWDRTKTPICTDKSKILNDIETDGRLEANIDEPRPPKASNNHFFSLNQLRAEIGSAIETKQNKMVFYLDIGINKPSEVMRAVQNAFKMVATKESIDCIFTVSVSQDLLVNIDIKY